MATYPPPLFTAGQIVDVRYSMKIANIKVRMPDRNYIDMVYRKATSNTWLLSTISEAKGGMYYVKQDQLFKNQSSHSAAVYKLPDVQRMLELGFRFVKNMPIRDKNYNVSLLIEGLKKIKEIDEIVTMDALDTNGVPVKNEQGVWIKYKKIISDKEQIQMPDYTPVYKA